MNEAALLERIKVLELRLLEPGMRSSSARLDELLAADFVEFGASGRRYDKAGIVASIGADDFSEAITDDFEVHLLAPGLALATYRLRTRGARTPPWRHSLRSSLWVLREERWQLRFHQGTSTAAHDAPSKSVGTPSFRIVPYEPRFVESCAVLLATVPEWFGIPEANAGYLRNLALMPSWVALAGEDVVGAITLEQHFAESFEVHFMAVRRDQHRRGIGRALLAHLEREAVTRGARWLQVKTLGPSEPDEGYARTRAFYLAMGFSPLFESTALFGDPRNPALVLVKRLGSSN
jgi:GNAT superfamily N-acetyltransferase